MVSVSFLNFSLSLVLLMWKYFSLEVVVSVVSNSFKSKYLILIL